MSQTFAYFLEMSIYRSTAAQIHTNATSVKHTKHNVNEATGETCYQQATQISRMREHKVMWQQRSMTVSISV